MKLLRITSDRNDGVFSMSLNDGFTLKAHSKIALQSLTFEQLIRTITIGASNDEVTIIYKKGASGVEKKIKLAHNEYNTDNIDFLFEDLRNKLNKSLNNYDLRNVLGLEWNVKKNNKNRINLYAERGIIIKNGKQFNDAEINNASFSSDKYTFTGTGTQNYVASSNFITRGSGRLYTYNNVTDADIGSYIFGLSETNPTTLSGNAPVNLIKYGFFIEKTSATTLNCQGINNGSLSGTNYIITKNITTLAKSHRPGIEINSGLIRLVVYDQSTNTVTENELETFDYGNEKKLYPYIINAGVVNNSTSKTTSGIQIRGYTESPYLLSSGIQDNTEEVVDVGAIPSTRSVPTDRQIIFESGLLADFLGFNNATLPNQLTLEPNFVADRVFLLNSFNDSFVVVLDDMQLDSYDSQEKGRKNILSIVPSAEINETGVVYEPNNYMFIDINNNYDINLSNIRLRVLQRDLSTVETRGLSVIGLLIKDKEE